MFPLIITSKLSITQKDHKRKPFKVGSSRDRLKINTHKLKTSPERKLTHSPNRK
jgi:hypothetical protein